MIFEKPISEITEADLDALVQNGESEGKHLEFKAALPGGTDVERKEFLYDVSSFANAAGGYIIYGIKENEGRASGVVGVDVENGDRLEVSLRERVRDGIRPQIYGLEIRVVGLAESKYAVVVHIPKSWNPPHQVVFQKSFKFFSRDTNTKYQIDVDELRSVFALSSSIADKMREFRANRIAKIVSKDFPAEIRRGASMVTHFLPFSSFSGFGSVDLGGIAGRSEFVDMVGGYSFNRYNVDGYVVASEDSYAQIFNAGCIEVVHSWETQPFQGDGQGPFLPGMLIGQRVLAQVRACKHFLRGLGVSPPAGLAISLTGVRGWRLATDRTFQGSYDRAVILPSETVLQGLDGSDAADTAPLLDAIWRAAGLAQSPFPRA